MKRNLLQLGIAVFSVMSCSPSVAHSTRIIYGLDNATHFHGRIAHDAYIQIGNFKEKSKAYRQQRDLRSKTRYAVKVVPKGKLYAVLMGPLHSSTEIRALATKLSTSSTKTPVHPVLSKPIMHHEPTKIVYTQTFSEASKPSKIPTVKSTVAGHPVLSSTGNWYGAVGAGVQFPGSISDMVVNNNSGFPAPYNQDLYAIDTKSGAVVALSAGYRWERDDFWIPAYSAGVSWQYYFNTQVGNTIMQNSIPEFLNYNYTWNVQSNLVLATAKVNIVQYDHISPYVNAGIGAALNNASGYSETALANVTPRISPGFADNTASQFAYQIGTGIDVQVTPQIILSLGYNYQNLGNLASGSGVGTWADKTLGSGSYGSNEVLASVNYLFGK